MIFVGAGALLLRAINYSLRNQVVVDAVCCPRQDYPVAALMKAGVRIMETDNPNEVLRQLLTGLQSPIVFSINNRYLLDDDVLESRGRFFNIHNGLVQQYRGAVEVCIFAALCNGERQYGTTLHQLLPQQKVDSGPVLGQLCFEIGEEDRFSEVLSVSMSECQKIFELHLDSIVSGTYRARAPSILGKAYSYKDVPLISARTDAERLAKASHLGPYDYYFTKLASIIKSVRERQEN